MQIGQVARIAGIPASTLRYYERVGLLSPPERVSGRRRYTAKALDYLAVIAFARATGFKLAEIKRLFLDGKPYSARMRAMAEAKLGEIELMIRRAEAMKNLLRKAIRCRCLNVEQCGKQVRATQA